MVKVLPLTRPLVPTMTRSMPPLPIPHTPPPLTRRRSHWSRSICSHSHASNSLDHSHLWICHHFPPPLCRVSDCWYPACIPLLCRHLYQLTWRGYSRCRLLSKLFKNKVTRDDNVNRATISRELHNTQANSKVLRRISGFWFTFEFQIFIKKTEIIFT